MNNIIIPNDINYIEMYFTLRCNLGCDYCINKASGIIRNRKEMSAIDFANNINRFHFNNNPLTIGGGEPTIRDDFYDFVKNLRKDIKIDLLTNLSFDLNNFIKNIKPNRFYSSELNNSAYKSIRVSYHPQYMNPYELIDKAKKIQKHGYAIGIFGINHPLSMESNIQMAEIARKNGIYFFIKDFLGYYENYLLGFFHDKDGLDGIEKKCKCRTKEILISPDGKIHRCHRDLYNDEFQIGKISDENLKIEYIMRDCNKFGLCNPCDLKIKANRFLQMGSQSTEIEYS